MEKIPNTEFVPSDPETSKATEVHAENVSEKIGDAPTSVLENEPARATEGESAQRINVLRKDILSADTGKGTASVKPAVAPSPTEVVAGGGGGFGGFGAAIGKALKGGFIFLGGLFMITISEGFSGMAALMEKMSKGKGGGGGSHGGGASHAKAPKKAASSSGHTPSGGHGGGGHH
jgi:hypothetical protein